MQTRYTNGRTFKIPVQNTKERESNTEVQFN